MADQPSLFPLASLPSPAGTHPLEVTTPEEPQRPAVPEEPTPQETCTAIPRPQRVSCRHPQKVTETPERPDLEKDGEVSAPSKRVDALGFDAMLLTDPTPDLVKEVKDDQEFIDLRWWPDANLTAPLHCFTGPGRASDILATLEHRGVPDPEIRTAIQANWAANGKKEAARHLEEVTSGYYARQVREYLTRIAPAFTQPADPAAYWEQARFCRPGLADDLTVFLRRAREAWATYGRYATTLGQLPHEPPRWIRTLSGLIPVLEAFETQHPKPAEGKNASRRSKKATPHPPTSQTFLVSWGNIARWVQALSPEAAATTATAEGLAGTGDWIIVQESVSHHLSTDRQFVVTAILPAHPVPPNGQAGTPLLADTATPFS
jgi:hypothetical protein